MLAEAGEVQQDSVGVRGTLGHVGGIRGADGGADEEAEVARLLAAPARLPDLQRGRLGKLPLEAAGGRVGRVSSERRTPMLWVNQAYHSQMSGSKVKKKNELIQNECADFS